MDCFRTTGIMRSTKRKSLFSLPGMITLFFLNMPFRARGATSSGFISDFIVIQLPDLFSIVCAALLLIPPGQSTVTFTLCAASSWRRLLEKKYINDFVPPYTCFLGREKKQARLLTFNM